MRTRLGIGRMAVYLLATVLSIALTACGGGGGGGGTLTSGGAGSSAAVGVSVASAPDFPAGTTFSAAATPALSSAPAAATFDNVLVTVTKIALLPTSGPEFPDRDGELEDPNDPAENGSGGPRGFITMVLPNPVVIDLLHPPSARKVARLLNKFDGVPAGEYSKIRVYYSSVVGWSEGVPETFHPTAHYHFDVHFVGGNLVVPVATDPQGGIRFYEIAINVVGLKIHRAGNSGNVLLRPQVFATVAAPKYLVHGEADNVVHGAGTFDILTPGGTIIHAAYNGGTDWLYVDEWIVGPQDTAGAVALRDTAIVDAIGVFQGGVLQAEEVDITFPDVKTGAVDNGWLLNDTFVLRLATDNVVYPQPDRLSAYYDNVDLPHAPLSHLDIDNNVIVRARGYAVAAGVGVPGGIDAFWITIGP